MDVDRRERQIREWAEEAAHRINQHISIAEVTFNLCDRKFVLQAELQGKPFDLEIPDDGQLDETVIEQNLEKQIRSAIVKLFPSHPDGSQ